DYRVFYIFNAPIVVDRFIESKNLAVTTAQINPAVKPGQTCQRRERANRPKRLVRENRNTEISRRQDTLRRNGDANDPGSRQSIHGGEMQPGVVLIDQ